MAAENLENIEMDFGLGGNNHQEHEKALITLKRI